VVSINEQLQTDLVRRKQQHLYRQRKVTASAQQALLRVDGRDVLSFCSNDYLGLANHPEVIAAFKQAADRYGVGSGASHLVCGHSHEHHQLEEELAAFTGRDRALLFSTGYMANIGTVNALLGKQDSVFEDRLNHASLLDAGLSSGARFQRFRHNDTAHLAKQLAAASSSSGSSSFRQRKLIVVDGVFSMDGDFAPLPELSALAQQHKALLMVDDAHGFGCVGARGSGTAEYFGLTQEQLPVLMGTLGKAVGTFGAFIAGNEELIETLIQSARTYIYTTALPPAVAAATRTSLRLIEQEGWRRSYLQSLIERFRRGAQQLGLPLMDSTTAIQPLVIGDSAEALRLSDTLADRGIMISAIRPPTVAVNTARLRITFSAAHTEAQVDSLLAVLEEVML
jgi:8-amino-7-oxononanoate synthase